MKLRSVLWVVCAFVVVANLLVGRSSAVTAQLLLADGTTTAATLAQPSADGKLAFEIDGKRISPEPRDLVRFGVFARFGRTAVAVLDRGDGVVFSECVADGEQLRLQTAAFGEVRVPLANVRGLVFQPPADVAERDRVLDALVQPPARKAGAIERGGVRVTLDNGDVVDGKLESLSAEELLLESTTGKLTLAVKRVRAIAFALPATTPAIARGVRFVVGARDGSRITVKEVALTAGGLQLALPWEQKWTLSRDRVAAIQTLGGKATYLSDLQASGYKHIPYLATTWPLANDRSVAGSRLRAGGAEFLKGLGMHSAASATYVLDRPYRRFEAALAIDDSAQATDGSDGNGRGSVVFRVYVDTGDGKWSLKHTSATIRGGEAPAAVSVDLSGAKRLSLIVDFADRADEGDRADWLDARVVE